MQQLGGDFIKTLVLNNIKKKYGRKTAVHDVSFSLENGDFLGLIGENGAGKSTTLSMIATLCKPTSGEILLDDTDIVKKPKYIRQCLGYVPQDIALYPNLSGLDNLKFWGKMYHLTRQELNKRLHDINDIIGLSEKQLHSKVSSYSGGMKRRVNIGAALLHNPDIVIMDEPTVGIDIISRNQILDSISELSKSGKTIIYTGHYLNEVEKLCNKICFIDHGKVIAFGYKKQLLKDKNGNKISLETFYQDKIGQ